MVSNAFGENNKKLKIGILGARGIGKVHARIFHSQGTIVHAILGTNSKSASDTALDISNSYGFKPLSFHKIEDLLNEPIDAVVICTPPHLHYEQILTVFNKGLPVFCEKPLFWEKNNSIKDVYSKLKTLKTHPNRRFFLNAPSALFLDEIRDRIGATNNISSVKFSFYTNGQYKGIDIGEDILTHGISIIYKLFGFQQLSAFIWNITEKKYSCSFKYGTCKVEFDFREDPTGSKFFALDVDGRVFKRIQEGFGATYNIYFHDSATDEKIKVNDPFEQSIKTFIEYCKKGAPIDADQFEEAEVIMSLMAECLIMSNNRIAYN